MPKDEQTYMREVKSTIRPRGANICCKKYLFTDTNEKSDYKHTVSQIIFVKNHKQNALSKTPRVRFVIENFTACININQTIKFNST